MDLIKIQNQHNLRGLVLLGETDRDSTRFRQVFCHLKGQRIPAGFSSIWLNGWRPEGQKNTEKGY